GPAMTITWTPVPAPLTCPSVTWAVQHGFHIIDGTHPDKNGHVATAGNDNLWGDPALKNYILGLGGNDDIHASDNGDIICGGPGNDRIIGGASADWLYGEGDNDNIQGGGGADAIFGGDLNDVLYGQGDGTYINGGNGNDFIDCGSHLGTLVAASAGTDIKVNCP